MADLSRALAEERNRNDALEHERERERDKDPYAAVAAAAAAAAVAASEAIYSTRQRGSSEPHGPHAPRDGSLVALQGQAAGLVGSPQELSQSIMIATLQDELRLLREQREADLAELERGKAREVEEMRRQRELDLQRLGWEREQVIQEKEQELQVSAAGKRTEGHPCTQAHPLVLPPRPKVNPALATAAHAHPSTPSPLRSPSFTPSPSHPHPHTHARTHAQALQLVQQLELSAVTRATEREMRAMESHLEDSARALAELQRQRDAQQEALEIDRLARAAEAEQLHEARQRDVMRLREEQAAALDRLREASERALMEREHELTLAHLDKLFVWAQQQSNLETVLSQVRPLQTQNQLLVEMLDTLVSNKADAAIDVAFDGPLFSLCLHELCLQADYLEGEGDVAREARKEVEKIRREAEEELAARQREFSQQQARRDAEIAAMLMLRENDLEALKHLLEDEKANLRRAEEQAMLKDMSLQKERATQVVTGQLQLVQARLGTVVELEADLSKSSFGKVRWGGGGCARGGGARLAVCACVCACGVSCAARASRVGGLDSRPDAR